MLRLGRASRSILGQEGWTSNDREWEGGTEGGRGVKVKVNV